jgi:hypothetical protein
MAKPHTFAGNRAGRLAEARGLMERTGRWIRGGDVGGGAWLCVVEAVVAAEAVAPSTDARAKGA